MRVILAPTTSAASSVDVVINRAVARGLPVPVHFTAPGLTGAETATLEIKNGDGTYTQYKVEGVLQQITADNTGIVVFAPGTYRITKSVTSAAVGIEVVAAEV